MLINLKQGSLEEEEQLSDARKRLHDRRTKRPRPHLDDKVQPLGALLGRSICT